MNEYANLELGLQYVERDTYTVEFWFSLPNNDATVRPNARSRPQAVFNFPRHLSPLAHRAMNE